MYASHNDQEADWISRVVACDDQEAFAKLVRLHQAPVRQFLRRLVKDGSTTADDLAQEVFFKAYRYIAQFRGEGKFLSWLLKIAYQTYLLEKRKRRGVTLLPISEEMGCSDSWEESAATEYTFDNIISGLREAERTALLLHYRFDMDHTEVSDAMRIPLGTAKSLIRRAREKLVRRYGGVF